MFTASWHFARDIDMIQSAISNECASVSHISGNPADIFTKLFPGAVFAHARKPFAAQAR